MMFRVLGPLEIETDRERITLPGQRPRALLTALLLQPNAVVPAHRLVEALWGEDLPDAPTNALQQVVGRLRSRLGAIGMMIVTRPSGYVLVADPVSIDAERFESDYRAARSAWPTDPQRAAALLDGALEMWRGPAYSEFADGFARAAATRLEELRLAALEDRAALLLQSGAATDAIASARELMTQEPLRERPVELLMQALHADGRAGEALAIYQQHRALLANELGLDPGPELRALQERILQDDLVTAKAQRLPVAPRPTVADASPTPTSTVPTNLPVQLTSFVGRQSEIARTKTLLSATRLLTVTGPGGTGKTRFALHVATDVSLDYPDGVFFVDLAPVSDPALVVPAIAAALEVREEGWERPITEALIEHLRDRQILLLLDNFEQVLDAATSVARLLAAAPALTVLATSRTPLRVRGEQVMPLKPLQVADPAAHPRPEQMLDIESVALFAERATAVDPGFRVTEQNATYVAALVDRLDGLPLAIELTASRIAVLSVEAMLQRMERGRPPLLVGARDLPPRQQTLQATIGWSYQLLEESERILFRRLSVLAGGFTIEAAAVCAEAADDVGDILPGLMILTENSLILSLHSGDGDLRFRMLQTIREFGFERLEAEDDRLTIERRHATWFLELAEKAEPDLRGPQLLPWLIRLEAEHDNLRAALRWAIDHDEGDIGLRIVGALWRFWHLAGHLSEGRRWATTVLELPSATKARTVARARALAALGGLAYWQNDVPTVRDAYEQALAISRQLGDERSIAEGTYNLAFAYGLVPTKAESRDLFLHSREMFERLGNAVGVADTMWALAMMAGLASDYATARNYAEESVRLHRELGDAFGLVDALGELGRATRGLDELDTARSCFLEALEALATVGYRTAAAIMLENLAAIELTLGSDVGALQLAGAADALTEAAGGQVPPEFKDLPDPRQVARRSLSEDRIASVWNEGRAMTLEEAFAYARGRL